MPDNMIDNEFRTIAPSSTIGIIGGGQLGRMMAMAAAEMGYHAHIYCPEQDCPAREVAKFNTIGAYDDIAALTKFARSVDVITYEFENIPAAPISKIAEYVNIFPSPHILSTSQHRVLEKQAISAMGIETAPFIPVNSLESLENSVKILGLPAVLKTSRMGYDGKGQAVIRTEGEIENSFNSLTGSKENSDCDLVLEGFIDFSMEISVIVARDIKGNIACYCPVKNTHKNHILAETIAPAPIPRQVASAAEDIATRIAKGLDLTGLLAIEMFVTKDDKILVNEIAPRPHNSGHWTMDAAVTSQFEQVIRAVCGLPLGNPNRLCDARMVNLIGNDVDDWQKYLSHPDAKLHLYGKKEVKSGRKMGHVTFLEK